MDDADSFSFGLPSFGLPHFQPPKLGVPRPPKNPIPRSPRARPAHVAAFINAHLADAQEVSKRSNVPVSNILAAAAVETGWGAHVKGNAWFGVTGRGGTVGAVKFGTHEYTKGGQKYATTRSFRAYESFREAAEDYAILVTTDKRYAKALPYRDDPLKFAEVTGKVYATNPRHAQALQGTIKSQRLTEYDNH